MKRSFLGLALVVALFAQVHTSLIFFHWLNAETATVLTLQLMLAIGIRFRLAMANMELLSGTGEGNDQDRVALQAVVNAVEGKRAFRVMLVILSAIVPIALYTVGFALDWTNRPATDRAIWLSIVSYGSNIISVLCMEVLMALAGTLVKGHVQKLGNTRLS